MASQHANRHRQIGRAGQDGAGLRYRFAGCLTKLSDRTELVGALNTIGLHDIRTIDVTGKWRAPSIDWVLENAVRTCNRLGYFADLDSNERTCFLTRLEKVFGRYENHEGVVVPSTAHIAVGRR